MRRLVTLALLAVTALPAVADESPVLGIGPFGVSVRPDGREVYVPLFGQFSPTFVTGTTAAVLDGATGNVLATIPTGVQPEDVAFTPEGRHAFITNSGSATVTIVDTRTRTVVSTVEVGKPDATYLYGIQIGTVLGSRTVTVRTFGRTIQFVVPAVRTLAYVNSTGGNADGSEENVFVLEADARDRNFGKIVDTIELSGGFTRGDLRRTSYVSARGFPGNDFSASPEVAIFRTRDNSLRSTITVHPAPGGVHGLEDLALDPAGRFAYVAAFDWVGGSDEVYVVDVASGKVSDIVRLGTSDVAQHGIAVSPDGLLVAVTNFNAGTVSWIFTPTHTVVRETTTGAGPNEVAFRSDGRRAFVTNQLGGTVSWFDLETSDRLVVRLVREAIAAGNASAQATRRLQTRIDVLSKALDRGHDREARVQLAHLVDEVRRFASAGELTVVRAKDLVPPSAATNQLATPLDQGGAETFDPTAATLSR